VRLVRGGVFLGGVFFTQGVIQTGCSGQRAETDQIVEDTSS
jgi:hypothetical protein